jgi:dipeptidyl aminopeptidase/acylaminoacyl peptidase
VVLCCVVLCCVELGCVELCCVVLCCAVLCCAERSGSTAFGEAALRALPGRCGALDVSDCVAATKLVTQTLKLADPKRCSMFVCLFVCLLKVCDVLLCRHGPCFGVRSCVLCRAVPCCAVLCRAPSTAVFGGSHGGFLTTHLIGQYPTLFTAAATRNPVTNVAAMSALTDIPDWCYAESGLPYSPQRVPTAAEYAHMLSVSPIVHAGAVQTPLLMLLGASDARVPIAQGIDYYKLLKARGVNTRYFPPPHLSRVLCGCLLI